MGRPTRGLWRVSTELKCVKLVVQKIKKVMALGVVLVAFRVIQNVTLWSRSSAEQIPAYAILRHISVLLTGRCQWVTCARTWSISWMLYQASVGQVLERDPTAKSMEQMASPSISFLPTSSKPRKVCKSQNKYSVLRKRRALVINVASQALLSVCEKNWPRLFLSSATWARRVTGIPPGQACSAAGQAR